MNGFPAVDPRAAQRAERTMQAREQVKLWTNAMKSNSVGACVFSLNGPQVDAFALWLGAVDDELRESGYSIVSHTCVPVGQQGEVVMCAWTFLVRAIGVAPRVVLA